MAEGHAEGLSFVVAPDVTLQAVLAAECLLAAVAGTVERLLACSTSTERESHDYPGGPVHLRAAKVNSLLRNTFKAMALSSSQEKQIHRRYGQMAEDSNQACNYAN